MEVSLSRYSGAIHTHDQCQCVTAAVFKYIDTLEMIFEG